MSLVTWSETHAQCTRRLQSVKNDIKIGARRPWNSFTQPSIDFMDKVLDISGLSDQTFLPDGELFHQQSTTQTRTYAGAHSRCLQSTWPHVPGCCKILKGTGAGCTSMNQAGVHMLCHRVSLV